jgi:coenzyme F420-0:L-glutamate ligase/coenzyme F420-1:gamma-L-glutamate ligase
MTEAPTTISLQEFLRTRRSIRQFTSQPVDGDVLARILETATYAPSAHNRQPCRFAVLTSPAAKTRLADEMGADFRRDLLSDSLPPAEADKVVRRSRQRIEEAPVVVLLCQDPTVGDDYPDAARQRAEYIMGLQGVTLAGGTLLLAAHAEGLGGVWVCAPLFAQDTVRQALGLPENWEPQGMLLLGYPARIPPPRRRRPIQEVTLYL